MFRKMLIVLTFLAAAGSAAAEPSKERGFYLVGAAGRSIVDEGGSFGNFGDDSDRSLHFAAGYKIFRFLSVEARYVDFGKFDVIDKLDLSATTIHAVGIVPFGQTGWEFFGQLGVGSIDVEYDFPSPRNGSESTVSGGIGFRWHPTPRFAIGIQTDAYVWDSGDDDWDSSVGGTQLSLQVIF
jgi:hypothetical protein